MRREKPFKNTLAKLPLHEGVREKIPRLHWRDLFFWYHHKKSDLETLKDVPKGFCYPTPIRDVPGDITEKRGDVSGRATWINHNTFLVEMGGVRLLTDPIWSKRCSPLPFVGPKRQHAPSLSIEELPPIDFVCISHNHYDHLDKQSVWKLFQRFPEITWMVPKGVKRWFNRLGIERVEEFSWWEKRTFKGVMPIEVMSVPSQHFSGRGLWDRNRTLWGGWVVNFGTDTLKRLYYAGDTGYNSQDFKKIGERFGKMDLSLIPIGTYIPRVFMSSIHVGPEEAVKIHEEVGSVLSLGMHWKTFCLSSEPMDRPPYDLYCAMKERGLDPTRFLAVDPGVEVEW